MATKFKEQTEDLLPTRKRVLRLCANACAIFQLPPNFPKYAKQDTLLLHCNLPVVDHLKRMMEFGFQGERRLARFKWGILYAKSISGKRSKTASHLADSPSTYFSQAPGFLVSLNHNTWSSLSMTYLEKKFSDRQAIAQAILCWGPRDYSFSAQPNVPTRTKVYTLPP